MVVLMMVYVNLDSINTTIPPQNDSFEIAIASMLFFIFILVFGARKSQN